jgi:preprotein translocase subunit SecD
MAIIAAIGMAVDGIFFNRIVGDRLRARWGTA